MKASEFEQKFDRGEEDITPYLLVDQATRLKQQQKRVNVDFPIWMVEALDQEAQRLGVTRQSVIKFWISERLSSQR